MKKLSDFEFYIMNIIWKKEKVTSFDILDIVEKDKKYSGNAVRTILSRMVQKKLIYVSNKCGKTYVYRALINKEEYILYETEYFLKVIYKDNILLCLKNLFYDKKIIELTEENKNYKKLY